MMSKQLEPINDITLECTYDPQVYFDTNSMELQDITIYPPPLYIMSPRIRLYRAKDIIQFKGWVSKFKQENMDTNEPVLSITITPVNVEPISEEKEDKI